MAYYIKKSNSKNYNSQNYNSQTYKKKVSKVYYCFGKNINKFNYIPFEGTWKQIEEYLSQKTHKAYVATLLDGSKIKKETFLKNGTKIMVNFDIKKVFYTLGKNNSKHWIPMEGKWIDLKNYLVQKWEQTKKSESDFVDYSAKNDKNEHINDEDFLESGTSITLRAIFKKRLTSGSHLIGEKRKWEEMNEDQRINRIVLNAKHIVYENDNNNKYYFTIEDKVEKEEDSLFLSYGLLLSCLEDYTQRKKEKEYVYQNKSISDLGVLLSCIDDYENRKNQSVNDLGTILSCMEIK